MKWEKVNLGDVIQIKHGWAFKGEYFSSEGELIIVTPGNFIEKGGFRQVAGKEKYYLGDFPAEYLLKKNDLVIAMTEQGEGLLGSPALIPSDNTYLHNQRIGLVNPIDRNKTSQKYLYYLFFTPNVRNEIFASATGTKVKHTAPGRIYSIGINLPPLPTQRKIASILSAYDDLIENNRKRIRLLEEQAFLRYKMLNKTQKLYLSDLYDTGAGGTPSRTNAEYFTGEINWFKSKELADTVLLESEEKISLNAVDKSSAKVFPSGSVIMAMYGATIGKLGILSIPSATNQACCAIMPRDTVRSNYYIMNWLLDNREYILSFRMGAAQENISQQVIKSLQVSVPDDKELQEFNQSVEPMYRLVENLLKQTALLREARDILLPRLMSGEIEV
jgi:type I restriction enzyme S subunit